MSDASPLLTEPTSRAARAVALALLDAADAARLRLDTPRDREALHDFRVALRRLRSWLRAYRKDFDNGVARKLGKRLGTIANNTAASRDIEVHLEWLAGQRRTMQPAGRSGAAWLARALTADRVRADAAFRACVAAEYAEASARLRKKLSRYPVAVWDVSPAERLATTAAGHISEGFTVLRQRLAAVEGIDDDKLGHRARIAAKRLRYILEPLENTVAEVGVTVTALKGLQDLLGSLHDAHAFTRMLRRQARAKSAVRHGIRFGDPHRHGLRVLATRLTRRRAADWQAFVDGWMPREFSVLSERVSTIVAQLRELGGSGVEIERKFLLRALPPEAQGAGVTEMEQGYLPGAVLVERLRRVTSADGTSYVRTVKSGSGIVRFELEEPCTKALFDAMWPFTKGRRLRKRRYRLVDAGQTWEIDEFLDRTLVLAEVELASEREEVVLPEWLERHTEREVTGDPEYLNANLAT